jgi:hypothetical protein
MHLYGGGSTDDNGLLADGYSVPPGTQYGGHTFRGVR